MKYEYLKGSEKDFEGAPEWASQVIKSTSIYGYAFVDEFGYMCKYQSKDNPCDTGNIVNPTVWKVVAKRRQITEPSWDGVGMPPVGCECECHAKDGSIFDVLVIAFDGELPVVKGVKHGNYFTPSLDQLRPILSEADKKRDAAIKAIDDCFPEYTTDIPSLDSAIAMYEAIAAGKIPGVKLED